MEADYIIDKESKNIGFSSDLEIYDVLIIIKDKMGKLVYDLDVF